MRRVARLQQPLHASQPLSLAAAEAGRTVQAFLSPPAKGAALRWWPWWRCSSSDISVLRSWAQCAAHLQEKAGRTSRAGCEINSSVVNTTQDVSGRPRQWRRG